MNLSEANFTALAAEAEVNLTNATLGASPWCQLWPWMWYCHPAGPAPPRPGQWHPPAASGSCAAQGCGGYQRGRSCQCNAACARHGNCCGDYRSWCEKPAPAPAPAPSHGGSSSHGRVVTGYHQTSPELAQLILKNGFRPGHEGWCGGGIYFAATPQATYTKAIGPESHKGFIIEAQVDLGRDLHLPKKCDTSMTGSKLQSKGYDSITFNPGDGTEYVVYSKSRVKSMKKYSR